MSSLILSVVCVIFFRGTFACFHEDTYHTTILSTNSTYYQECQCNESGYSLQNLVWLDKDNNFILAGPGTESNIYIEYQSDSVNLHISNISKTMSGTYQCVTEFEGQRYIRSYKIEAYDPMYFYDTSETQHLVKGSNSRINCTARGDTTPIINWEKVGEIKIKSNDKYEVTPQGVIVKNVTKKDAGEYKCTASVITTGEEVDKFIKVEIDTIPVIINLNAIPEANVAEGEPLSIECQAEGEPNPEYHWQKISDEVKNANHTWEQHNNTIFFNKVTVNDSAIYECTANNSAGTAKRQIEVNVLQHPKIIDFSNRTESEGTMITLTCNATGRPGPIITISAIKRDDYEEGEYAATIPHNISWPVEYSSQGLYVCNATNEMGTDVKEMYLTVLHKPYFHKMVQFEWGWNGKTVNLSCAHKSNPPAETLWRFQGNDIRTEEQVKINKHLLEMLSDAKNHFLPIIIDKNFSYGVYECEAKNSIGKSIKTVTLKEGFVPPQVTNASIIDITATSVLFLIDKPDEVNGPNIVGFTAEYDEAENYKITNIHINRTWAIDRPFKLEKLKPNTKYQVRFAAVNDVGAGAWSDMMEFNTLEKSVPEPPVLDVDCVETSSGCDQLIKWKAPVDNGEPIDYYVLRYCMEYDEPNELCLEELVDLTTSIELHDLQCNTTYHVELVAHNSEGNSTAANISFTTPAGVEETRPFLSAGIIIGIAVVVVILCLVLLDVILFAWKKQGIIASCYYKKNKKKKDLNLNARDKKGLLRDNRDPTDDSLKRANKGHKEYEYNKTTGVITGKHSAV